MDLEYLIRRSDISSRPSSIFMFHGYGSNKDDLFSLEQFLPKSYSIISFNAPISLPFGGYSWFNIDYSDIIENNLDSVHLFYLHDGSVPPLVSIGMMNKNLERLRLSAFKDDCGIGHLGKLGDEGRVSKSSMYKSS